jgi:hypothetical protein
LLNLLINQIPRSYENLKEHISKKHKPLLESFEKGWKALSPSMQINFFLSADNQGWTSWIHYAVMDSGELDVTRNASARSSELSNYVAEKMHDVGDFYGLPFNPPPYLNFPLGTNDPSFSFEWEMSVARKTVKMCLDRAKIELVDKFSQLIQREGVNVLNAIAEGERKVFSDDGIDCLHKEKVHGE